MLTNPQPTIEDFGLDATLRPRKLSEYQGQNKVKENLKILIEAARQRKEPIEHVLLCGAAGLGKTTLAHIIASEMGVGIKVTSGPAIERVGDLGSILTNLSEGDVLFIDEAHRLNKLIEEVLYPAMEDFKLDIVIGKGPSARTLQLDLPHFTLIAATTRPSLLSSPLRSRFGITFRLDFYQLADIAKILNRSARILNIQADQEGTELISQSARFTPRVANRLLKRVRDYAQVRGQGKITGPITREALEMLEVDSLGLEPIDRQILKAIIEKFDGGPVGLQALAAATNEEQDTIEDIYEPYLMQLGFIGRTPRGRTATRVAYEHLGLKYLDSAQDKLIN
ncbi:MAG: Holliday junction branch migration DNA helicase RuvB [Candidatus Portnoybacteria bacterium CG02_land_8_20_14_3_00_45_8]|uniref:Holliday junction branch migration complex subunit RuvB n=1 Tax=Candidatus Portnoybacteria bacterium CG02_land_8_20_14_3_00_45_8 TaxID=1974807 RepID=A0A2M7D5R8_9BACT|nr:MAG: Holliday junction branch migration DNA helicase RuvB [Candidatus Portnoybacteria bacterium CG02_land_8_20_14_3_00_45_8]